MCIRFNPKNPDLFFATTSEGMVYSCNIKDGSCQEIINGKTEVRYHKLSVWCEYQG